jgi:DNA-directed RNA polymerase specialized sigma subunit
LAGFGEAKQGGEKLTNQEKIQFLRQYRSILEKIELLKQDILRWRELGEKITPSLTRMPKSGQDCPKVEQAAVMLCDIQSQLSERIAQSAGLYMQILQAIESVEDVTLQNLLHRRYIDGEKWEEIAVDMHYSYMHVCRLHGQALEKIML